jgi:CBS domain-containing protein
MPLPAFPFLSFKENTMQVSKIMSRNVTIASPDDVLQLVALLMDESDCGIVPVGENDRLIGMVTDRDITTRAVARGVDPLHCTVREVMTTDVKFVYEDETLDAVERNMARLGVRRLPVLDRNKRLVGIVSLGDMAIARADRAGAALEKIAKIASPTLLRTTSDNTNKARLLS